MNSPATSEPLRNLRRRCDSCRDLAVGVVTFVASDGRHDYHACLACAVDALTNSSGRVVFRTRATHAEVFRGFPGQVA